MTGAERMDAFCNVRDWKRHETSLVTTPDGLLIGLVRRENIERSLGRGT